MRSSWEWMRSSWGWMRSSWECMKSRWNWTRSSWEWMNSSWEWMRSSWEWMRSSWKWMISSWKWMRSSWKWMISCWDGTRTRLEWMKSSWELIRSSWEWMISGKWSSVGYITYKSKSKSAVINGRMGPGKDFGLENRRKSSYSMVYMMTDAYRSIYYLYHALCTAAPFSLEISLLPTDNWYQTGAKAVLQPLSGLLTFCNFNWKITTLAQLPAYQSSQVVSPPNLLQQ
jgi:hypothetical protein